MRTPILFLLLSLSAALLIPAVGWACSLVSYQASPPATDLGETASSPGAPVIRDAFLHEHTIDDSTLFGCGGSSCDGVTIRYLELRIAPTANVDRYRITYPGDPVPSDTEHYVTVYEAASPDVVVRADRFGGGVGFDVEVAVYDAAGNRSAVTSVTVTDTRASLESPNRQKPRPWYLALALGLAIPWFRRVETTVSSRRF